KLIKKVLCQMSYELSYFPDRMNRRDSMGSEAFCLGHVGERQPADCIQRQSGIVCDLLPLQPAQRRLVGMAGSGLDAAQHGIVAADVGGMLQCGGGMYRCASPWIVGAQFTPRQIRRGQMYAIGLFPKELRMVAVDQQAS